MKTQSLISMGLLPILSVNAAYTWPSKYDELEDILYLQAGYRRYGFRDGVTPCGFSADGSNRETAAEWIKTAYHDMATHDVETGLGGLDASIAYELGRAENPGSAFNGTFGFTNNYASIKSSNSDLLAMSVVVASMACGGPIIPFRAGRIDAVQAGVPGVPQPDQDLATHTAIFAKQGFNTTEMITMVACGHVLGGVHGVDFPQITGDNNETSFPHFNSQYDNFTNSIVTEYLEDKSIDVLVVGKNDTFNSDKRIFGADNNKTMTSLADPSNFQAQCRDIFARMIDTVPASVTLSEVITPIEVKPTELSLALGANNTLSFTGSIRVRTTHRNADNVTVSLRYRDRNNNLSNTTISTERGRWQLGQSYGFAREVFTFYEFDTAFDVTSSISSFDVIIHTAGEADEINTNNGLGFPVSDAILLQAPQSCQPQIIVNEAGQWNLTITAAVRADRVGEPVAFDWVYKRFIQGVMINQLEVQRTVMEKASEEIGGYYLYTATKPIDTVQWSTTFDLVLGEGDNVSKLEFLSTGNLASTCQPFP
ncbi:hypothetical protein sscle_04g035020 [Sclerotinia sclerotiorum 1980 UF-70]|uniref:Peroxidase n=1 Tax=Sclerotinia sclerotiorum (strain ATCC 18683 / 1980 / Ss-1) TaxID=665079 RepID=A0A1D9Q1M3_SCLS1|nr:hypothetical protein sscle_04g035020 [Sclerotinia sclerotiorum 1980 UF-70]